MKHFTRIAALIALVALAFCLTGCEQPVEVETTYNVTFDSNGGSAVDKQTVKEGEKAKKPADPIKGNYEFGGWYNGETEFNFDTAINADITLKAKWNIPNFTVTFNSTGGSDVTPKTVAYGSKVTKPADPTKDHYEFEGWYTDSELTKKFDFNTAIESDLILKAKWTYIYIVTFETNGGNEITPKHVESGSKISAPENATKHNSEDGSEAYKLEGWYKDSELKTKFDFDTEEIKEDIKLYAKWTTLYKITVENGTADYEYAEPGTTVTIKVKKDIPEYYYFSDWRVISVADATSPTTTFVMPERAVRVSAYIAEQHVFNITLHANGGTFAEGAEIKTYNNREYTALPDKTKITKEHYIFDGWYEDEEFTSRSYSFVTDWNSDKPRGDREYWAKWKRLCTVTYDDGVEDEEIAVPVYDNQYCINGYYSSNLSEEYKNIPYMEIKSEGLGSRKGYIFAGWKCGDKIYYGGDKIRLLNLTEDFVFVAQWIQRTEVTGKIGKYASPAMIGDIVFTDGSATFYTETLTDVQKAAAVAVIFYVGTECNNEGDNSVRTLGVGIKNTQGEETKTLSWGKGTNAADSVEGVSKNFTGHSCTVSTDNAKTAIFEGHLDGTNNWQEICDSVSDENISGNYPAWEWVNNYGLAKCSNTNYTSGWYLPTIAELSMLYRAKTIVNSGLGKANGNKIENIDYWTSSQIENHRSCNCVSLNFTDGRITFGYEYREITRISITKLSVCAIREF